MCLWLGLQCNQTQVRRRFPEIALKFAVWVGEV